MTADCAICGGSGITEEAHDDGTHPVHCPCTYNLAAENTRLRQQIADLEAEANTLAAAFIYALTAQPNREPNSQGHQ